MFHFWFLSYLIARVQIFVEHWGDNLLFYPNFARFSTLGEMNLDHNFFWVSKLSEEQKKRSSPTMEHFFSPNLSGDLRSDAHQSQIIGGDADVDHTQIIGGDNVKLLGRIYPPIPPGFRHPCLSGSTPQRARFLVCCMNCQHLGNYAIVILILIFYQVALAIRDRVGSFWSSSQVATCPPLT